jgi:hypothetical protein
VSSSHSHVVFSPTPADKVQFAPYTTSDFCAPRPPDPSSSSSSSFYPFASSSALDWRPVSARELANMTREQKRLYMPRLKSFFQFELMAVMNKIDDKPAHFPVWLKFIEFIEFFLFEDFGRFYNVSLHSTFLLIGYDLSKTAVFRHIQHSVLWSASGDLTEDVKGLWMLGVTAWLFSRSWTRMNICLGIRPMGKGGGKAEAIWNGVLEVGRDNGFRNDKLVCLCTDGDETMVGKDQGVGRRAVRFNDLIKFLVCALHRLVFV